MSNVGNITPDNSNTRNIGTSSNYWLGIYAAGFYKNGSNGNYVLLGNGEHKQWTINEIADTIVVRDSNKRIHVNLIETNIADTNDGVITSIYYGRSDKYIYRMSLGTFATKLHDNEVITITKSLTITEAWIDTGIICNTDTFPSGTGTYVIQISAPNMTSDSYFPYYSGIMTIYTSSTNSSGSDEVPLHVAGHACGSLYKRIYIRTVETGTPNYNKIQIAGSANFSQTWDITFRFRKII